MLDLLKDILQTAKATGKVIASKELSESRLKVCGMCSFFVENTCEVCGCNMKLKTKLLAADCPKDRWREKLVQEVLTGTMTSDFEDADCCI